MSFKKKVKLQQIKTYKIMTKEMQKLYDKISELEALSFENANRTLFDDGTNAGFEMKRKNMQLGKYVAYGHVKSLIEGMEKAAK